MSTAYGMDNDFNYVNPSKMYLVFFLLLYSPIMSYSYRSKNVVFFLESYFGISEVYISAVGTYNLHVKPYLRAVQRLTSRIFFRFFIVNKNKISDLKKQLQRVEAPVTRSKKRLLYKQQNYILF